MEKPILINPLIVEALRGKATMHLDVLEKSKNAFSILKKLLFQIQYELNSTVFPTDKRLKVEIKDRGQNEIDITIASDTIIFILHSNIFIFDSDHILWKTSYFHDDPMNAHCSMISVYNFLSDSFTYNRANDVGYLVTRIFINKENHFYAEGKKQLGFLYNDFENAEVTEEILKNILETTILHCLEFDMYTPPFDAMGQVTIHEILNTSLAGSISTGKRLGFRLQTDVDNIT